MVNVELLNIHTIVVTYNGLKWIPKCLNSLLDSQQPVTIHVIDNASTDETAQFIAAEFPSVLLTRSPVNLGFGQANNVGIRRALDMGATHVFLLNQDAWVEPGTLGDLIAAMDASPRTGILSPLHLEGTGQRLDLNFRSYLSRSQVGPYLESVLLHSEKPVIIPTKFVNAAAWLISRDCLLSAGGFDPIFFHYGEDAHYCSKVLQRGMNIGIHSGSRIRHDREQRLEDDELDKKLELKKEWVQFLVYACDIHENRGVKFCLRRAAGHFYRTASSLVTGNTSEASIHLRMAIRIIRSLPEISACRKRSITSEITLSAASRTLI